jgi:rhodanese-related sulfurtransferase
MNPLTLLKSLFATAPQATPIECAHRIRSGEAVLVDVREPGEWVNGVAKDAALLPLSDLTGPRTHWQDFFATARSREVLLYCAAGRRASTAALILAAEGFRAVNTGGLADWATAGWPVVKPKRRN